MPFVQSTVVERTELNELFMPLEGKPYDLDEQWLVLDDTAQGLIQAIALHVRSVLLDVVLPSHPDCRMLYLVDISKTVHDISAKP
jgi:hypothetical protein